ncbi:glycoside hydrolase family 15 [Apiospora saccharicola]
MQKTKLGSMARNSIASRSALLHKTTLANAYPLPLFLTRPDFDSPSLFCRLLDKDKGGYFSIAPNDNDAPSCTTKQQYLPSSGILQTRYIHEDDIDIFPAFGYAKEPHETQILKPVVKSEDPRSKTVTFSSPSLKLQLDVTIDRGENESDVCPSAIFKKEARPGMAGEGVVAKILLTEGQAVSFILREDMEQHVTEDITTAIVDRQQNDTQSFWFNWLSKSTYKGGWREVISRSLMILKMLTYEPTGAIVAAPTFSIPEDIGGSRNWDYRFSWVRDSSFTIYILLRLGFTEEADAYMEFMNQRFVHSLRPDGGLPIMFTIRGETDIPEIELDHLHGYKGSRPVRIGNGAAHHHQHDIYGELMDGIYLYNKYGKPITWDTWVSVRQMLDHVLTIKDHPDMSIWEVRSHKQHFVYSKIMMWVAFDRGLRLAEKRCLPCPTRQRWLEARDSLCEEIHEKGWCLLSPRSLICSRLPQQGNGLFHPELRKPDTHRLVDPHRAARLLHRPERPQVRKNARPHPPAAGKGGLTSTGLVYRYDTELSEDGVGGREGAFSMCTFWLVEAMTRASVYEPKYLTRAVNLFENMLSFSNHLSVFSEEIARSGEQLGNTPQAFSHLALISAAFNLDRVRENKR